MKPQHIITATLLLLIALQANATPQRAKAYYMVAEKAFSESRCQDTLSTLEKAENILGETNARILALKVRATYCLEDYEQTQTLLTKFWQTPASDSLVQSIAAIEIDIEQKLAEYRRKQAAQEQERLRLEALAKEEKKRQAKQLDGAAFERAIGINSVAAYEAYLNGDTAKAHSNRARHFVELFGSNQTTVDIAYTTVESAACLSDANIGSCSNEEIRNLQDWLKLTAIRREFPPKAIPNTFFQNLISKAEVTQLQLEKDQTTDAKTIAKAQITFNIAIISNQDIDEQLSPKAIQRAAPTYPRQAIIDGIEGYTQLSYDIDVFGHVQNINIIEAEPRRVFDRAAKKAVKQWKFETYIHNGSFVTFENQTIQLDFNLN